MRTPGVSMRPRKFVRASTSVRPMFCSCSVRRTSLGERLLDLRRREPERLREAETRLERDDHEIDQVGQVLLDLVAALARLAVDDEAGGDPAEDPRGDRPEDVDPGGHVAECPEGEPPEREGDGREELHPEQPLGRCVVHPGRDEPRPVVGELEAGEAAGGPAADRAAQRVHPLLEADLCPRSYRPGAFPRSRTRRSGRASRRSARPESRPRA